MAVEIADEKAAVSSLLVLAATNGVTLTAQLRGMLRADGAVDT